MTEHRYIVVEGPIGVGKTTLASKLAQSFGCNLLLEGAAENPFLPRFYDNPRAAALPTQLFFLLQRARHMQELRQDDLFNPVRVADFLMEKDRLFARLTLDEHELALYEQVRISSSHWMRHGLIWLFICSRRWMACVKNWRSMKTLSELPWRASHVDM